MGHRETFCGFQMRRLDLPILTPDEVHALRAPTGVALGLPGRAYFSPAFYEAERRSLYAPGWVGAGFASDIAQIGDAKSVTIAGWELLLVRATDGSVKCFHNICRHRGMKIVDGKCSGRNLRCPYHSWSYSLDGKLTATPAISGKNQNDSHGIVKEALGLLPVRCEEWFGVVFINLDQQALSLREHLQPVLSRLDQSVDLARVKPSLAEQSRKYSFPSNWKVVLEGLIEDYHLPLVNQAFTHSADYTTEDGGSVYAGFSSRKTAYGATELYGGQVDRVQLPVLPGMLKDGIAESLVLFLFPNTVLSCSQHSINVSLILPTGPESVDYLSTTHFSSDASAEHYRQSRDLEARNWTKAFEEHEELWKAIQAQSHIREELGLATRFSSHWERGLHLFQLYVAEKLFTKTTENGSP
jgi:choline monooxygenase